MPFISSQPVAAVVLEICLLLYIGLKFAFLIQG
jgi:hypothetical protein